MLYTGDRTRDGQYALRLYPTLLPLRCRCRCGGAGLPATQETLPMITEYRAEQRPPKLIAKHQSEPFVVVETLGLIKRGNRTQADAPDA
eukprot:6189296-Prymnesium_polylepis.2